MCRFNMAKIIILLIALVASIHANNLPLRVGSKTVIDTIEYSNIPENYVFNPNSTALVSLEFLHEISAIEQIPQAIISNLNEFADKIFVNIDRMMLTTKMDPAALPDIHAGFSHKILFIDYHGDFDLTKGHLDGVSTIRRGKGDVLVNYNTQTKLLEVTVPITFNDLGFKYDYSVQFMNIGPRGSVIGKVSNVNVQVKLSFDFKTFHAALDKFYILNTNHISFYFTGNILFDWLLNILTGLATTLLKGAILLVIEGIVRGTLDNVVNGINSFIAGILNGTSPAAVMAQPNNFVPILL